MNYLARLQKYTSGKNHSSSNIQSKDGVNAYVTSTGVTKRYETDKVFQATAGKRNCGGSPTLLTPTWSELGFPIGTKMVAGQSCGNENTYVQSTPPPTHFQWKYYAKSNPDLNLTTEKAAVDHWNAAGKYEGRLPNPDIMSYMAETGRIGYVDVNTQLHPVRTATYKSGVYTPFMGRSNVTGTSMVDCSRPVPPVRYGEQMNLLFRGKKGGLNTSSTIEFGNGPSFFVLRPPVGVDVQGRPVQYGDEVSMSTTMSNYTSDCGWWGCKVGKVNTESLAYEFGPGGETASTVRITPPPGSAHTLGDVIKYNDPVCFTTTIVKSNNTLEQGKYLLPGESIRSDNGKYMFIYQTDGNVCLYNTSGGSVWCSMALHTPGKLVVQDDGNVVAYDSGGIPQWSTDTQGQGTGSYVLTLRDDRTVALMDSSSTVLWSTQTVSDSSSPVPSTPVYAYVSNQVLVFGSKSSMFTFQSDTVEPTSCDVAALKAECDSADCIGFIHSPESNEWQMITPTSESTDYMITSTMQDVYVKNATVDVGDKSCDPGTPQFVDSDLFSHYVKGSDLKDGGHGQCNVVQSTKPYQVPSMNGGRLKAKLKSLNVTETQATTLEMGDEIDKKSKEYRKLLRQQQGYDVTTLEQQNMDLSVFDAHFKSTTVAWVALASALVLIMMLK